MNDMDAKCLHLVIGRRTQNKAFYPLDVETVESGRHHSELILMPGVDNLTSLSGKVLGSSLYQSLVKSSLWDLVKSTINNSSADPATVLIEIKAPEFFQAPWEQIREEEEFSSLDKRLNIIRFLDKPSTVLIKPLKFPISVLVFSGIRTTNPNLLPTNDVLEYFKSTTFNGGDAGHLEVLLNQAKFDIVHIRARAVWFNDLTSAILSGWDEREIKPESLLRLLKRCGTRLLILQCIENNYRAILNFSHHMIHPDGPAIITILEDPSMPVTNDDIYFNIAHDNTLDSISGSLPYYLNPALFITSGGADILRISAQVSRVYGEINNKLKILNNIKNQHRLFIPASEADSESHQKSFEFEPFCPKPKPDHIPHPHSRELQRVNDMVDSLKNDVLSPENLDFKHERGALIPLSYAETINNEVENQLKKILPYFERVVNTWFKQHDRVLLQTEMLIPETEYSFEITIGVASESSNVKNAIAIPEKELARFYSEEGLELNIELYSNDFRIPTVSKPILLPKPPGESPKVSFKVFTPGKDCLARMRVCIYYKLNLVQSLLVKATVGNPDVSKGKLGNQAELDFSLSGSLNEIDRLPSRKLNIAVNESDNGTHTLYIKGKGIKEQLDFGEGELINTAALARAKLQGVCGDTASRYKYDQNNKGKEKTFISDLIALASFGYKLYTKIFMDKDWDFQNNLTQAIAGSGIPIQIALTSSAKNVYPWALVYDKPLVKGEMIVCQKFLSDLKTWDPAVSLSEQSCIKYGCPDQARTEVVCPSGFWGYRHIIEQPISRDKVKDGVNEMSLSIGTKGKNVNLIMGVSQKLTDYQTHLEEIKSLGKVDSILLKTKQEIGIELHRNDLQVVYFYCHGGREGSETWLGIGGKDEKLTPSDLFAWGVRWHSNHPLIFINGCHTVDATPDDFIEFNSMLARCEAAGVIGTEISIPEILARYFAIGFFQNLFEYKKVGVAIREQRLDMLKIYNLLGLAYTPYCYADLEFIY